MKKIPKKRNPFAISLSYPLHRQKIVLDKKKYNRKKKKKVCDE